MHIWYIHHYAGGPGLGTHYRPYHLARAWQAQGHTATIFMAGFHHLLETKQDLAPNFEIDGAKYVAIPARRYAGNGVGRILNMWDFATGLRAAGLRQGESVARPDAIVVSSPHPFAIFAAHALARKYQAKLVFEIRDIWPLSLTEILGVSRWHPFVQMCAFAERFALRRAHLIASVLPRADRYLADRGYGDKPFVWVPNGIAANKSPAAAPASESGRAARAKMMEWKIQGKAIIVYAGSIGAPNGIDLLIKAIHHGEATGGAGGCAVLVIGRGEQLEAIRTFVAEKKLSNINLAGWVPKNDAVALLGEADIAYAGLRNIENLFGYGISPNKIADYFSASLPIVLPIAPCGDPVSESGGGIGRRMETPEEIWEALEELVLLTPAERRALGARGSAYMAREYDYDSIARNYIAAIERLLIDR